VIKKNTIGKVSGRGMGIELEVSYHIEAKAGDRVVVLGRRGQGSSTFLNMIAGLVRITEGQISLNGKIAFLS
jgi:ABC-type sugar transport system ATPase subunit